MDFSPIKATTTIFHAGLQYAVTLWGDLPFYRELTQFLAGQRDDHSEDLTSVPVRIRIERGYAVLSFQQLQSLEPDDVIVLNLFGEHHDSLMLNIEGSFTVDAIILSDSLVEVKSPLRPVDPHETRIYSTPNRAALMMEADISINQLQINMSFDLGVVQLPIAELSTVQPGYIFTLPTAMSSPVTISANGQAIGRGEIVRVGDLVGVRIIRLFGHER